MIKSSSRGVLGAITSTDSTCMVLCVLAAHFATKLSNDGGVEDRSRMRVSSLLSGWKIRYKRVLVV